MPATLIKYVFNTTKMTEIRPGVFKIHTIELEAEDDASARAQAEKLVPAGARIWSFFEKPESYEL